MRHADFQRSSGMCARVLQAQLASSAFTGAMHEEATQGISRRGSVHDALQALFRAGAVVITLLGPLAALSAPTQCAAQPVEQDAAPIRDRNIDVLREGATQLPLGEEDQALHAGWPLYRTQRAQAAFNEAMATLEVTDRIAPTSRAFKGCERLECNLSLPSMGADGWIPAGRLWVSPAEYVLIVHSPRLRDGQSYRRRAYGNMRYFVFHEFANSSHNTDVFDTISSHNGSVFVPLYMSKQRTDAKGRHLVIVLQVAPYDVVSIHASNKSSAGPGMEVAKNLSDALEPLQGLAGILVATIVKTAAPHLEVVNHQHTEGLPMLSAYERRLAILRAHPATPIIALPFVSAPAQRLATATARLEDLIVRRGGSPLIALATRGIVPQRDDMAASAAVAVRSTSPTSDPVPTLIEPIRLATRPSLRHEPVLVEPIRPAIRPATLPDNVTGR